MNICLWSLGLLSSVILSCLAGDIIIESKDDGCRKFSSCSSCLAQSECTWCVTKSLCTKQLCGNDNVIFPKEIPALMSGLDFCPRIVNGQELTLKSGKRNIVSIKITQIYLYMAFTPWKCKINVNGKQTIVPAVLIADYVYCESFEFRDETENPYVEGSIMVLWDYNKAFDGSLHLKICRCDLAPTCSVCDS